MSDPQQPHDRHLRARRRVRRCQRHFIRRQRELGTLAALEPNVAWGFWGLHFGYSVHVLGGGFCCLLFPVKIRVHLESHCILRKYREQFIVIHVEVFLGEATDHEPLHDRFVLNIEFRIGVKTKYKIQKRNKRLTENTRSPSQPQLTQPDSSSWCHALGHAP